ncbi:ComEA family DNA-binding protein [Cardiobacterium valvarum]|uniref:ComEA protein n=1 Tax=Cardiobacterium valvarum TaxID=194702 RepID=A0A381EDS0_9GAMM|nr:helix-hairpin-helix domain-containing protein [Cardiobacterium valvarum]SUX25023.1 comEA protein [Cardiobacterium valvarum]
MNKICKILLSLIVGLSTGVFAAVNINTANVEELQQLKGIGAKKAAEIVAYREAHGEFKNIDELTNVKGIGKATLEKLREELVVKNENEAEVKDKSPDNKQAQSDVNANEVSKDVKEISKDAIEVKEGK